jgi:hypothetical protein
MLAASILKTYDAEPLNVNWTSILSNQIGLLSDGVNPQAAARRVTYARSMAEFLNGVTQARCVLVTTRHWLANLYATAKNAHRSTLSAVFVPLSHARVHHVDSDKTSFCVHLFRIEERCTANLACTAQTTSAYLMTTNNIASCGAIFWTYDGT